jgi:hypothetical protein
MLFIDDQHPVEELAAQVPMILSQTAFALGACGGAGKNPDALGREQGVERAGELASAILIRNLTGATVAQIHQEVTRGLCCPCRPGFAVMPAR